MPHLLDWVCGTCSALCTFEVPFLPSRQSLEIWDKLITLRVTLYHKTPLTRGRMFVLLWNTFNLEPIRSSICDCRHCLATSQAQFLHRLIKRHYCSLLSSSPCLSVRRVDYNCYQSFPLKSTWFLGLACNGLFLFFHWPASAATFKLIVPQLLLTIHSIM